MTDDRATLFSLASVSGANLKFGLLSLLRLLEPAFLQYLHDFAIRYIAVAQLVFAPVTEEQQRKAAGAI